MASLQSIGATDLWHLVPVLVLGWLALFFGRSLRAGRVPLIERIARVSNPALTPALCRYTRGLTVVWCAYFGAAALLASATPLPLGWTGVLVWVGTFVLFVGEHRVRRRLFPGVGFPNLRQQLRDTWSVWHPGS